MGRCPQAERAAFQTSWGAGERRTEVSPSRNFATLLSRAEQAHIAAMSAAQVHTLPGALPHSSNHAPGGCWNF